MYRIEALPLAEHDDLVRLWLWSRGRNDRPQATCSLQTALDLHGLSDGIPDLVDLTVPPGFRKPAPRGCVLHVATLVRGETQTSGAVPATIADRVFARFHIDVGFRDAECGRLRRPRAGVPTPFVPRRKFKHHLRWARHLGK